MLVGTGAVVWLAVFRDTAEPVSVEQAVADFRSEAATGPPEAWGDVLGGVYVYATEGFEEVDALFGSRHDYPPETSITVASGGCGVLLRWEPLEDRSTTWELCPGKESWAIAGYREVHTFFRSTRRTSYRCEPGSLWWPPRTDPGFTWKRRCSTGEITEAATGEVLGSEPVGRAERIAATHLSLTTRLDGTTRGTGTFDVWLAEATGFPMRIAFTNDNRTSSPIGDVRYSERVELTLTSLEPER